MKIIFAGTPVNAAETLSWLIQSGREVVAVLTREDAEVGRKKLLTESPVASIARQHSIPLIKANKIDQAIERQIRSFAPDLGLAVAYGVIFKKAILEIPTNGWINLHYSLLPAWRGAAPVQHAIKSGNPVTGVSIFQLDEGMDTGPVLATVQTQIEPGENAGELLKRLTSLGISALSELMPSIEAGIAKPIAQPLDGISVATKISRADARINFADRARAIELLVRAMNPEPMAWCEHDGTALRIIEAVALGASDFTGSGLPSAEGSLTIDSNRVLVSCGQDSLLELKTVQPAGKNPMDAAAWARGLKESKVLS